QVGAQSERRAPVPELAAFARGAAAPGRFCPSAFGPPPRQGEAGGAPARRDQAVEGRSRRRRAHERGDQGALRADLQGVALLKFESYGGHVLSGGRATGSASPRLRGEHRRPSAAVFGAKNADAKHRLWSEASG